MTDPYSPSQSGQIEPPAQPPAPYQQPPAPYQQPLGFQPYPPSPQPGYGYPPPPGYGGYGQPQQGNGLAVAGMVCGIVGLVLFWVPILGWILAILAIIFGGVGLAKANKGASGKGQAIAGLVLGVVSIALYVIIVIALLSV